MLRYGVLTLWIASAGFAADGRPQEPIRGGQEHSEYEIACPDYSHYSRYATQ